MSKISDLAADFETKSTQQASDIEHRLQSEFKRHERHITEALKSSEHTISNAID
ncbi:MbeB family mobilization protein, partial [Photobacterium sanguinicancri]|uniref:MbeB family mobilization protein n=1 Tax=Photobacterium sanguinicancri TaxID=875932 RepID=UPI00349F34B2